MKPAHRQCIALNLIFFIIFAECQKISHVIVLMEENRSFDHLFGYYPGVNGLTGKEWNAVNTSDPNSPKIYVDKTAPYVAPCDPDHSTTGTTYKIFGANAVHRGDLTNANMSGFVERESSRAADYCRVMSMFTPDKVPIISTLASEFVLFDRFFCAHAGPTWPNRMFFLSGTSAGSTETFTWYHNQLGNLFPQKTIYDQIAEAGLTWKHYYNDTPWELFMESVAHHPENIASLDEFFADSRDGKLPNFAFINPRGAVNLTTGVGSNDMHPDHDVAAAEQYYKDIYESLRSSPLWESTLFIITFDEHGGFYDHVSTPISGVPPPGDGEKSYPETGINFDRLGVRIPTIAISPWLPKGLVVSEAPNAQKPFPTSEYDLTSIIATTRKILGMNSPPLTKRDAWSATFEHILEFLDKPRTDCPIHLPPAPPVTNNSLKLEAVRPPNDLQRDIMSVLSHLSGVEYPHHVKHQKDVSQWSRVHFENHATRTKHWKKSKSLAGYALVCQPATAKNWVTFSWDINRVEDFPIMTISTIGLQLPINVPIVDSEMKPSTKTAAIPYCLDAGTIEVNSAVTITLCYPSQVPKENRDKSQQWIFEDDATIRPYVNQTLCLTARRRQQEQISDEFSMILDVCGNNYAQHFGYDGPAPGNPTPTRAIGLGPYFIGIINSTNTK